MKLVVLPTNYSFRYINDSFSTLYALAIENHYSLSSYLLYSRQCRSINHSAYD